MSTQPSVKPSVQPGTGVQRRIDGMPVLHLEPEIPPAGWDVVVDGLVTESVAWSTESIRAMASEHRLGDLHCVSGWSRLGLAWEGVPAARLIDAAGPRPNARFVLVSAAGGGYTSCFPLNRARTSLLAWGLDGGEIAPEHGGPLRLVPPPTMWAYKDVKWVARLTLVKEFTPGFWENRVGDPYGDIAAEVLDQVHFSIPDERRDR